MSPIEQGVEIRIGLAATSVRRDGGTVTVTLGDGSTVTGNELLAAVARTLHWSGLGLKCVGIEPACFIEVDAHARVPGHDWLYVIGDLNAARTAHPHGQIPGGDRRRPRARQGHGHG